MVSELEVGGVVSNISNIGSSAIVSILCIVHAYRMYQDLFTVERKSVLHRRWLPDRNEPIYKILAWCTLLSVITFLMSRIFGSLFIMNMSSQTCTTFLTFLGVGYLLGKLFMYWIFLFRLRTTFGKTSFAYNVRWLNFWTIALSFYSIVNITFSIIGYVQMDDGCFFEMTDYLYIAAAMIMVQDALFSIGFVVAFVFPLKGILKYMVEQRSAFSFTLDKQQRKKVFYYAVKTTTLTCVTAISTVCVVSVIVILQWDVLWVDMLFNSVCLFLMTPYYDDAIYYQNICWCCARSCTPKQESYKSQISVNCAQVTVGSVTMAMSADTMDQIRVCASGGNLLQISNDVDGGEVKTSPFAPITMEEFD